MLTRAHDLCFFTVGKEGKPHSSENKSILLKHPFIGEYQKIKKDHNEAHRALGWMMIMDGKSTDKYKVIKNKSRAL
jgi:hypothetical protein